MQGNSIFFPVEMVKEKYIRFKKNAINSVILSSPLFCDSTNMMIQKKLEN